MNDHTDNLTSFIKSHGNPFIKEHHDKVKNFVTQVYAEEDVANMHANFFTLAEQEFEEFHKAVYIDKTRLLSDKITRFNLLPIDHITTAKSGTTKDVKRSEKCSRMAIKILQIAKEKDGNLNKVLKFDITPYIIPYLMEY